MASILLPFIYIFTPFLLLFNTLIFYSGKATQVTVLSLLKIYKKNNLLLAISCFLIL